MLLMKHNHIVTKVVVHGGLSLGLELSMDGLLGDGIMMGLDHHAINQPDSMLAWL